MFGAVIVAEGAPVSVGPRCVVLEHAVVRSWPGFPVRIGHDVHIGTGAIVNGGILGDDVFLAAGASIFPGAELGARSVVRMRGNVHINAFLPAGRAVPDGWTAVGKPAQILPPGEDERTIVSLEGLNFTQAIFRQGREQSGLQHYLDLFAAHRDDVVLGSE